MMQIPAAAHVVAWAVLGTGVGMILVNQQKESRRLDAIEDAKMVAPTAADVLSGAREQAIKDGEQVKIDAKLNAAEVRHANEMGQVRDQVTKLWAELLKTPEAAAASGNPAGQPGFDDAVRGAIDRYAMERKFRETLQKATGPLVPKKPSFVALATALKLRPEQAERFGSEIRGIQQELLEILQIPRADGVAPLEEIQQAEQFPDGSPKKTEAFMKLIKLKIPETEETYFERAIALASRVKEGTRKYFDSDQSLTLDTIDLDWFGIKMQ